LGKPTSADYSLRVEVLRSIAATVADEPKFAAKILRLSFRDRAIGSAHFYGRAAL
jgi:hypothetical protein